MILFNKNSLEKFLKYIGENFKVVPLKEWKNSELIVLRHDIELDIKDAYELYKLERKCGVRSTFLALTSCELYNPFSKESREMLREIANDNFEIGLHFDPTVYPGADTPELQKLAKKEAEMLSSVIGRKIVSISQHRPRASGDRFIIFKNFVNAYDPRIFSPDKYISDSRMQFRKDLYQFVKSAKLPIQILIHPDHFLKKGKDYPEKLEGYAWQFVEKLDKNFHPVTSYRKLLKGKKLSDYIKGRL